MAAIPVQYINRQYPAVIFRQGIACLTFFNWFKLCIYLAIRFSVGFSLFRCTLAIVCV